MRFKCLASITFVACIQLSPHSDCYAFQPCSSRRLSRHRALDASSSSTESEHLKEKHVVVVGGGVGGLAVASRIASSFSCQVTIVEKNSHIGGRCGSFETTIPNVGTFRHERGPSLLLLPDVYRDVFRECSDSEPEEYGLHMIQCIPAYQVVFEDGDSIDVGFPRGADDAMSAHEVKSREIMDSYETDGSKKWDEYMRATSAFLDCGLPNFIEERLDLLSFPNFLKEALRDFGKVRHWLVDVLSRYRVRFELTITMVAHQT
jgi:phytoene dehydrogenase-like protein